MRGAGLRAVAVALALAERGVDYRRGVGALCPLCGARLRIVTTRGWAGGLRVRYGRCEGAGCLLAALGRTVKSVEARRPC